MEATQKKETIQKKKGLNDFLGSRDLTEGSPMRVLLQFAIPLLLGNIAQQLYSTADSIIVGKFVGDGALAAVGVSMPVLNLVLVLFMAVSTGAGIIVAQYYGAKDYKQLSKSVGNALMLIVITSLITTVVGLALARPMMRLIDTPEEIFEQACQYLEVMFAGVLALAFYNIISGILRGMGDSVSPLLYLLVACGLNVALDYIFVAKWNMGVMGAAVATVVSQVISAILCLVRLFHMKEVVSLNRSVVRFDKAESIKLLKLGLPAGITQGIFSMAMVVVQSLINSMGMTVAACSIAVMRVDGFAMLPNFTFGMAISTYVGQNIGANKMKRVDQGIKAAVILNLTVSITLTLALLFFGRSMIGWFTDTEMIKDLGVRALRILAPGYIAMGMMQVFSGIMRGAGDTMPSMWISLVTSVILRVPTAYALAYFTKSEQWLNGSPDSIYLSLLLAWVMGAILNYAWYKRGKWRQKSLTQPQAKA